MCFLSVIVPVYNAEKYIRKCIESIINQTYKNLELILVDDGSTDGSGKICDLYGKKDERISVFHEENKGPLSARLKGIQNARGNYVTFVDADDWIELDTYETVMAFEKDADIVSFGIFRYFDEKNIFGESRLKDQVYDKEMINNQIIPNMLWDGKINTCGIDSSLCTKIFRKELIYKYIKNAEELHIYFGQDVAVTYPLLLEADRIVNYRQCFYYHRQREEGTEWPYFSDDEFFDKVYRLYVYLKNIFEKSEFKDCLQEQLDKYYRHSVIRKLNSYDKEEKREEYVFPYWMVSPSSRVILYGAGKIGKIYKQINEEQNFCDIVLWVDKASGLTDGSDQPQAVCSIQHVEYDAILIAVQNSFIAEEIRMELLGMGVPDRKIIWRDVNVFSLR